nr:AMP-binding protein [Agrococcus sp. ARC_14]
MRIRHILWRLAHAAPHSQITWAHDGQRQAVTQRAVAEATLRLVEGLRAIGVTRGSRVVGLGWNSIEYLQCMLAVPVLGATLDNINFRLAGDDIGRLMAEAPVAAAIVDVELLSTPDLEQTILPIVRKLEADGVTIIVIGSHVAADAAGWVAFEALTEREPACLEQLPTHPETDVAYVFHTGGTTGAPKSFPVSHRRVLLHALVQGNANAMGIRSSDRVMPLPQFFHANAWNMPFVAILAGADVVLPGRDTRGAAIAALLRDAAVTLAGGVPTLWHDICASVEADPSLRPRHLREIICSGSVLEPGLRARIRDQLGAEPVTGWGMTESMGTGTYQRSSDADDMGRPVPLLEIRSLVESDDASPRLQIRGPFVLAGDGDWYATGDIAAIGEAEELTLLDREKDAVKSGGEWISTLRLERALLDMADVEAAAVVARADDRWGERPIAYVVMRTGVQLPSAAAVRAHVTNTLPKWWAPDDVIELAGLPLTRLGKPDKAALRLRDAR